MIGYTSLVDIHPIFAKHILDISLSFLGNQWVAAKDLIWPHADRILFLKEFYSSCKTIKDSAIGSLRHCFATKAMKHDLILRSQQRFDKTQVYHTVLPSDSTPSGLNLITWSRGYSSTFPQSITHLHHFSICNQNQWIWNLVIFEQNTKAIALLFGDTWLIFITFLPAIKINEFEIWSFLSKIPRL